MTGLICQFLGIEGGGQYIKIQHTRFERYNKRNNLFNTLIILTDKELDIWQRYHSNIKVIPNFLPNIPQVATNHSQKVVLSVGRMDNGDQKGFLRLLDIWKMVRDSITCHTEGVARSISNNDRDSSLSTKAQNDKSVDCFGDKSPRNDELNLTEWQLIIVGDGVLKSEIQSKIHTLNLQDSVILKPFTKDIEREYLGASIYAMASHFEGFPMVLLESTAYGLAPISFDIATGPSDIIEHNKSGFLVADNDLESYADKLIALMSDESMRVRFGSEAKRIVSENFSKEVVMRQWEEVFEG